MARGDSGVMLTGLKSGYQRHCQRSDASCQSKHRRWQTWVVVLKHSRGSQKQEVNNSRCLSSTMMRAARSSYMSVRKGHAG